MSTADRLRAGRKTNLTVVAPTIEVRPEPEEGVALAIAVDVIAPDSEPEHATPAADEPATVPAPEPPRIKAAPKTSSPTFDPTTMFRARRRGEQAGTRISIACPRGVLERFAILSQRAATHGSAYLAGINRNAVVAEAANRLNHSPRAYVTTSLRLDDDYAPKGVLQGAITGEAWDGVRTEFWKLDPRPTSHGPLLVAAVISVLNDIEAHIENLGD